MLLPPLQTRPLPLQQPCPAPALLLPRLLSLLLQMQPSLLSLQQTPQQCLQQCQTLQQHLLPPQ